MHNVVSSEDGLRGICGLRGSVNNLNSLQCCNPIGTPAKQQTAFEDVLRWLAFILIGKGIRLLLHPFFFFMMMTEEYGDGLPGC